MTRKLVKTGGSLAVTLPHELVEAFNLKAGDPIEVSVHPQTGVMTVRTGMAYVDRGEPTKAFKRRVEALIRRRAPLYRELAK
jgi:antitoxin component of MazEF toxin-antitoxin module